MKLNIAVATILLVGVNAQVVLPDPLPTTPGVYDGFAIGREGELIIAPEGFKPNGRRLQEECTSPDGNGEDVNCCSTHIGVGCEDSTCEATVVTLDSFCCEDAWDNLCAETAVSECTDYGNCCKGELGGACGDPHFQTWTGEWWDFHGQCDLVLVHAPGFGAGVGLDAHLRTTGRYDYSFISAVALRIGGDVLEVGSYGDYMLNGISQAELPAKMASQYKITHTKKDNKEDVFQIEVARDQHIVIKTFKDLVAITFEQSTPFHYIDSVGLMGDFSFGTKLSRGGVEMTDDVLYGQEWQVGPEDAQLFFDATQAPQFPQQCIMPKASSESRRLGETAISHDAAKDACAGWEGDDQKHCIFDVIQTGDIEVAQVYAP